MPKKPTTKPTGWRTVAGLFMACVLIATALVMASDAAAAKNRRGDKRSARAAKTLDLTQEQKDRFAALRKQHVAGIRPIIEQRKFIMQELRGMVRNKDSKTLMETKLTALRANTAALRAAGERHRDAIRAVLTPAQQAKLALWVEKKSKGRRPRPRRR